MPPAHTGAATTVAASTPSFPEPSDTTGAHGSPEPLAAEPLDSEPLGPEPLGPGTRAYRRMSLALFAAGLAVFVLLYSTQALLPAISADFGVTAGQASWTVSAATGALALCVLPLSALSERFGRTRMMLCSMAVAVAVGLLVPFAPNLEWMVVLRAVQGAAIAGVPASAMAYLAEEVRPKALVAAIGLFVAGNSIGGMSGRLVTGWAAELWGWRGALLTVGLLALGCAAVFAALLPRARFFRPASLDPRALGRTVAGHLRDPLLLRLYGIGALFMTVFGAVYTVIGYRLTEEPFSLGQGVVGSVFLIYLVGTAASAAAGQLVARLGRRGALYLAVTTTALGLLASLSDSLGLILLGLVLITAGFFAGHAVASSSVSRTAKTGRAQASALYQSAYYLGSSAGGTLGALAYHSGGWPATAALALAAVLGVVSITVYGSRVARAERRAERLLTTRRPAAA
ncbi:MFS transporter [Streptomyces sp. NPDC048603]|uniref:MFS transporter n=1 Tax=Streptomyces sp. NPDC048603 TaxID=3365577 RepID=UPI0037146175